MPTPVCPHTDRTDLRRACLHLIEQPESDYCQHFTGRGLDYELLCGSCRGDPELWPVNLRWICAGCFAVLEDEGNWDSIVGSPGIAVRQSTLEFRHEMVRLTRRLACEVADIKPVERQAKSLWLALGRDRSLWRVDLDERVADRLSTVDRGDIDWTGDLVLSVSRSGEYAAVRNRRGSRGTVVETASGDEVIELSRGTYHTDQSEFPLAFCERGDRELLVHAADWDRLDVSDLSTGECLTDRTPEGKRRFTDYFHGSLHASPDDRWIADSGWVWAPAGLVAAWRLDRWIDDNPWESDDGESKQYLCQRHYFWDGPATFVGDDELAVWGYGPDEECLVPAVMMFSLDTGESRWFAGPHGDLYAKQYLYSVSALEGTAVWDPATGERLLLDPGFHPQRFHRAAEQFLSTSSNADFFVVSRLTQTG